MKPYREHEVSRLWIRVIKEGFGYYDDHHVGETFTMPLRHVTECVKDGYIEICVNNLGLNDPYDEPEPTEEYLNEVLYAQPVFPEEEEK